MADAWGGSWGGAWGVSWGSDGGGPEPEPEPPPQEEVSGGFSRPPVFNFPAPPPEVDAFVDGVLIRVFVRLIRGAATGQAQARGAQIERSASMIPGKAEGVVAPLTEEEALILRIAMLG